MALRHEAAQLLEYSNYAERSLATKMAESTDTGHEFSAKTSRNAQDLPHNGNLKSFATLPAITMGVTSCMAWDIAYYSEKLRQNKYAISQEELKPYFPGTPRCQRIVCHRGTALWTANRGRCRRRHLA